MRIKLNVFFFLWYRLQSHIKIIRQNVDETQCVGFFYCIGTTSVEIEFHIKRCNGELGLLLKINTQRMFVCAMIPFNRINSIQMAKGCFNRISVSIILLLLILQMGFVGAIKWIFDIFFFFFSSECTLTKLVFVGLIFHSETIATPIPLHS